MATPWVVALAGKGGTGKSTLAALLVRSLRNAGRTPILAVDADPNTSLETALGLHPAAMVSDVLDATRGMRDVPDAIPKSSYLEYRLEDCLAEGRGVDLVVMGRPEGAACYCAVNHLLRVHIDRLMGAYRSVVVDNEAGMEHVSRRTTREADVMLIVSDATVAGIRAARRIQLLVGELALPVRDTALVVDRATELPPAVAEAIAGSGLRLAGLVPHDPLVVESELEGRSLLDLPDESIAARAVTRLLPMLTATRTTTGPSAPAVSGAAT
jgi:CO dehydrogenase maturation factor